MSVNSSPQLHDDGEESWPLKIHAGCGGVYLDDDGTGYFNIDIEGVLAADFPNLVEQNKATITDYYARLDGDALHLPKRRETVADCLLDLSIGMPYLIETVDKIVAIQFFEHLSPARAFMTLQNWHYVLKVGHPIIISIPDMMGTLELFEDGHDNDNFALRHLRGRRNDYYQSHHAWYTFDTLCELVNYCGFDVIPLDNFHFYPAIVIRAIRR